MVEMNDIKIGDLVFLKSGFKRIPYEKGCAPIYRWVVGSHGAIPVGKFKLNQSAIVLETSTRVIEENFTKTCYNILTDKGESGWFCEGEKWLKNS
tara:strand:- start:107 stop:391 length:285 start_codon:yes stop_codon:yes gene_type:complete